MKDFNKILGLVAVIVLLLIIATYQRGVIIQQQEQLKYVELMARHEQNINPWLVIELIAGTDK